MIVWSIKHHINRVDLSIQKKAWISKWLLFVWCAFIFVLSSVPGNHYPQVSWAFADKAVHIGLYFWLGVFAVYYCKSQGRGVLSAWAFGVLFGATDEIHQIWVPRRTASFADLFADAFGVGLAVLLIALYSYIQRLRDSSALTLPDTAESMELS